MFCGCIVNKLTCGGFWSTVFVAQISLVISVPVIIYNISGKILHLDFVFYTGGYLKAGGG